MRKYWLNGLLTFVGIFSLQMPSGSCADLSLDQAIQTAMQQNTTIKITQKGEDTARAALRSARGSQGPALSAASGAVWDATDGNAMKQDVSFKVTASLPVYSGGKLEAGVESSVLGVKAAQLATARAGENVKLDVITAYYDILQAKKTVDVDQASVDNYQAHLENVQQLYAAGSKAKVDVLRSAVELSNARQTLIKAQNDYEIGISTLRNILHMPQDEVVNLTDDVQYVPFTDTLASCISCAYQQRKDLAVSAYDVIQKALAIKMAEADYKPKVDIFLGTSMTNQLQPTSSHSQGVTAGVNVSWNLFDSGVTGAAVDQAKASRDAACLNLDRAKETINLAVRQDYYNMREAEKRFKSTQDATNQAKEDFMIAREKYRAGEGVMLDIIDAQLALSTAELNYISAQYDYARYKAALKNAMGI